jgi:hypothetical protein
VIDALGRIIYRGEQTFNDKKANLQIGNISPGMYLLKLIDGKGQRFNFKFVVAKQ